ncbi:MAG: hypothetical protein GQ557_02755 [Mycoplasmataceae bacterium]|nr:hypothetical protein [Mycoplasmataceae bacterium]
MKNNINLRDGLDNRQLRIHFLYQVYLFNNSQSKAIEELRNDRYYLFTNDQKKVIIEILKNKQQTEKAILKVLPTNWKWIRFGNIEKAILLNAATEILIFKSKKAVAINEAIIFTKKYCDQKTPALINAILDNLKKEI